MYLALSQRSKSLLHFLTAVQHLSPQLQASYLWICKPYSKGSVAIPDIWIMTSYPFPSWSEVKNSTVCIFLSLVGKPIPECMWEPCSRNTGLKHVCSNMGLTAARGSVVLSCEWAGLLSIHLFSSFIMVLSFPILFFSLVSCPRHCLPFPSVVSSSFSLSVHVCMSFPLMRQTDALQSCLWEQ